MTWLENIVHTYQSASVPVRLGLLAAGGWALAPLLQWVERYVWSDWEFAAFMAVLVFADTVAGVLRAAHQRKLSARGFGRVFWKLAAYTLGLLTLHVLSHHTLQGQPNTVLGQLVPYLDSATYSAILLREVLSIHENLAAMGYGLLPHQVLKRFAAQVPKGAEAQTPPPTPTPTQAQSIHPPGA